MAQHVDDDAAVVLLAVVPRRPLRRLPVALEHPVAELAADRKDASEESGVDQHLQLEQSGKPQLVLHDAVLHTRGLGAPVEVERLRDRRRDRLLGVDVLACGDRLADQFRPEPGRRAVEVDRVVLVGERRVEIGGPPFDAVRLRERLDFGRVAADEDRIRHDPPTPSERDTAVVANRIDRANEMLIRAHAAGDAVHDHAETNGFHVMRTPETFETKVATAVMFSRPRVVPSDP